MITSALFRESLPRKLELVVAYGILTGSTWLLEITIKLFFLLFKLYLLKRDNFIVILMGFVFKTRLR